MADWDALRSHIKSHYNVAQDSLDSMQLLFETSTGRSQLVWVGKLPNNWASVSTVVCEESQIDARDALLRNSTMIIGGLALIEDGPVIFRHSFPLATLDPQEFEQPLGVAIEYGDQLEQELTGVDRF
jgi:hypothetical protein